MGYRKIRLKAVLAAVAAVVLVSATVVSVVSANKANADVKKLKSEVRSTQKKYEQLDKKYKQDTEKFSSEKSQYESQLAEEKAKTEELKKQIAALTAQKEQNQEQQAAGSSEKVAYLTFDDGPSAHTEQILAILKEKDVKATFFLCSNKYSDKITTIANEGHVVGMHSKTHDYKTIYSSVDAYFNDLYAMRDLIKEKTGTTPTVLRLPGGSSNTVSKKYCNGVISAITKRLNAEGFTYFDWNASNGDAARNNIPADKLFENVVSSTANGTKQHVNLLMHDTGNKGTTVEALGRIIDFLREHGYRFDVCTPDSFVVHHKVAN